MRSNIFLKIKGVSPEKYIFWVTLIFYILLLFINPSNKIIALSFVFLFFSYYLKIKKFETSLFLTFVSSLIVQTGKTYPIQLLPASVFPVAIYPQGYIANLIITSTHFIVFAMLLHIVRQIRSISYVYKTNLIDFLLIIFYALRMLSAILASKEPGISIPFELLSLSGLIAYFYAKIFLRLDSALWKNLSYLLSALVIFEGLLGFSQLSIKSPLDKALEYEVNIGYFGHTIDEAQFTFRPAGTFSHANILGIWISSVLIFLFAFGIKHKSNIVWLSFFVGCALMVVTVSRSAWVGFACGVLYFIYTIKKSKLLKIIPNLFLKWRFIIVPLLLFLFLFFVIPRAKSSIYSFEKDAGAIFFRRIQIVDAIQIIKLHPILGVGTLMSVYEGISLDMYTMAASIPLSVHTWYLAIALENGLLTLFVFLYFLLLPLRKVFESEDTSLISISIAGVVICLIVVGILQPYINVEFILLLLSLKNNDNINPRNGKKDIKILKV